MRNNLLVALLSIVFLAAACNQEIKPVNIQQNTPQGTEEQSLTKIDFAEVNSVYNFSGDVPEGWQVEYVPQTQAINIYDLGIEAATNLEKSQIFIRSFTANSFLTLTTVDVLSRQETEIHNRPAVRYEIRKKPGVQNFAGQPLWRSSQHQLIDIRAQDQNPSVFFVIAYNPALDPAIFEEFLASLNFN